MARRGENIYKRKDGRWEARYANGYKANGQTRYSSVYAATYREVKEKREQRRKELDAGLTKACRLTIQMLCLQWLERIRSMVKESSYARYRLLICAHIISLLGGLHLEDMTANTLSKFINGKLDHGRSDGKGGLSPKTVQDITIVLRSVLKMAQREYGCRTQSDTVRLPKAITPEMRLLSDEDLSRLDTHLKSAPNNSNMGILLCMYTGIRLGEVCALRWSDIDWRDNTLRIRKTVLRLPRQGDESEATTRLTVTRPKTRKAERVIPLPQNLAAQLRKCAVGQPSEAHILTGRPGRFMDPRTYQYRFQRLLERLGIERVNFHALRHTFATRCIRSGMDVKSLSEILGHSTVEMTLNRYVHSCMEMKRKQMDQLCFSSAA